MRNKFLRSLFMEADGGVGGGAGEQPVQNQQNTQPGPPQIDYERIAQIVQGKQSATENSVLKGYFKQQGLSETEMNQAIEAYKQQKAASQPDANALNSRIIFYDDLKTLLGYCTQTGATNANNANLLSTNFEITAVNDYYKMSPTSMLAANFPDTAFIRISAGAGLTGDEWIVTVDEEITEETFYKFAPTGRYYGTESLEIVSSTDEMTDTDKKYVLEETGTIWRYGAVGTQYTNQILSSIDADGNVFGLKTDYRWNSSDELVAAAGQACGGYIPVKTGDTVRFENINFRNETVNGISPSYTLKFYDDAFNEIYETYQITASNIATVASRYFSEYTFDEEGNIESFVLNDALEYAYLKLTFVPADEAAIITVNEEIIDADTKMWKDTGIKYAGTNNDDVLVDLEMRTSKNESSIVELSESAVGFEKRIALLEEAEEIISIPDYWKAAVDAKRDTILAQLDEGGRDGFGLIWGADIHGTNGFTNSSDGAGTSVTRDIGYIAQYAAEAYDLPFVLFSGDIMSQASHTAEESVHTEHENMWKLLSTIDIEKLLLEKGNHDGAYGAAIDGVYYLFNIGGKKVYNNLFRRQALDRTRVFGGDGSYFYVDASENARIIMLNSQTDGDGSVDENGYAVYNSMKNSVYGTEQLVWLVNVALANVGGRRVIVSAHQPLSYSADGALAAGILNAYNNRVSYSNNVDVSSDTWGSGLESEYNTSSIEADFSDATGKVVAYLHGHIHKDTIDNTSYSFISASITTAGADVRDTDPPLRTAGTATETALDIVIVTNDKIYFNRLGAGEDREISWGEYRLTP